MSIAPPFQVQFSDIHFKSYYTGDQTKWNHTHFVFLLELVSKELNHFGVIAGLFRQIGGHSSRFVLFCSFWRLFTIKMIKSVKVFPFSFLKITTTFFFYFRKFKPQHKHAKWPPSDFTPWTLTLGFTLTTVLGIHDPHISSLLFGNLNFTLRNQKNISI